MIIIILIIGILLDGLLTLYIPNSSYFIPLITVSNIFLIYKFLKKKEKTYFILIAMAGFIYDLLYTNLLFYHLIIYLMLGLITKFIYKNFNVTTVKIIIYVSLIISLYELLNITILFIYKIIPLDISKLLYKISHSLIINILYTEMIYSLSNVKSHNEK